MTDADTESRPSKGGRPRRPDSSGRLEQATNPSKGWYAFKFLNEHFTGIFLITALTVVTLVLWGRVTISQNLLVFAFFFVLSSPVAGFTGNHVKNWLFEDSYVYGVELKVENENSGGIYSWTVAEFRDLEIEDDLDWIHPSLFFATEVDYKNDRVVGAWRGRLSDRELATALENIRIFKDQMLADARKGFRLENSFGPMLDKSHRDGHQALLEFYREGTLPDDGDALNLALEDMMQDVDTTQVPEDLEDSYRDDLPDELPGAEEFEWVSDNGNEPKPEAEAHV